MPGFIGLVTAIAIAIFWINRAAREASDVAGTVKNLPRRRRFQKAADRRGLDLVNSPQEAATVMLVALARLDGNGRVSDTEHQTIAMLLKSHMNMPHKDADELVTQMRWITRDLIQPGTAIFPMCRILTASATRDAHLDLMDMMDEVAEMNGGPTEKQLDLLDQMRRRLGLV